VKSDRRESSVIAPVTTANEASENTHFNKKQQQHTHTQNRKTKTKKQKIDAIHRFRTSCNIFSCCYIVVTICFCYFLKIFRVFARVWVRPALLSTQTQSAVSGLT
jgi:hypothetical protein